MRSRRSRSEIALALLALALIAALSACGGARPDPSGDPLPPDPGGQGAADEAGIPGDDLDPEAPAARPVSPQAAELDAFVADLSRQPVDAQADLVEALPGPTLEALIPRLPEGALVWARLRLALLAEHHQRPREARAHLAEAVARSAGHPAAPRIEALRTRLEAQATVAPGRLGVLLPLSGPYGAIGKSALVAIRMAAKRAKIELVIEDTTGDADQAALAVERLVYTHRVPAIVGPVGALESAAAAKAAQRLHIPLMTLTAEEGVTDLGGFIFRHRLTASAQARTLARYAMDRMGLRRFALLYPDTEHGRAMIRAFWRVVEAQGGEIRGAQAYGTHDVDFSVAIKKLIGRHELSVRRTDPRWKKLNRKARDRALHVAPEVDFEALFIPDRGRRLRTLLPYLSYWDIELKTHPDQQARDLRGKYSGKTPQLVQILGGAGFGDPRLVERQIDQAQNAVFVDGWRGRPEARFDRAYEAAAGRAPGALAAHAYDATRILIDQVKQGGDRDLIRRRLLALDSFDGLMGETRFNGDGEAIFDLYVYTLHPEHGVVPRRGDRPPRQ